MGPKAINSFFFSPKLWTRFADYAFVSIESDKIQNFLLTYLDRIEYIYRIEATIKFSVSYGKDNNLPFIDVLVTKKKDGVLANKTYRKEKYTNRYLNYESCLSHQQKQGVIMSLFIRASKLDTEFKDSKKGTDLLLHALEDNNYSKCFIKKYSIDLNLSKFITNKRIKTKKIYRSYLIYPV